MKTAIIYSPKYLDHKTIGHPESPGRLIAAVSGIVTSNMLAREEVSLVEPMHAGLEELRLVHTWEYIERVRLTCEAGGGLIGGETMVSRESFDVARLAAGGAIEAARNVASGAFKNAFALVRPPGHHAEPDKSIGFCIFNNVALAAKFLIERCNLRRVAVLDIDAHHGNGTQRIFYDSNDVLYLSIHEDPSDFPKAGFIWEVGAGDGEGYTVNIPLPYGTSDPSYWKALKTIVFPVIEQYRPEMILISAGFDGYYRDVISELMLSAKIYPRIFKAILDVANKICGGRMAAILEGGYNLWFLRRAVAACISKMAGINAYVEMRDRRPLIDLSIEKSAEKIIEKARRIHSRYWSL